jgi:2-amino-4-hydroxy-6-hydroxymethyldihydropteridine diphosphokinase
VVTFLGMTEAKHVYLSLGSNLGDRAANLEHAIRELPAAGVKVLRLSSIYETEPVDYVDQPWFLNCVIEGETSLQPKELLEHLQSIERKLGSRKLVPRGPRMIDLDILFYGDEVIRDEGIEIPHPRMTERRFVLVPLAEIAPGFRHPVMGFHALDLLSRTHDQSVVKIWKSDQNAVGN